jgi:hypothetical protein
VQLLAVLMPTRTYDFCRGVRNVLAYAYRPSSTSYPGGENYREVLVLLSSWGVQCFFGGLCDLILLAPPPPTHPPNPPTHPEPMYTPSDPLALASLPSALLPSLPPSRLLQRTFARRRDVHNMCTPDGRAKLGSAHPNQPAAFGSLLLLRIAAGTRTVWSAALCHCADAARAHTLRRVGVHPEPAPAPLRGRSRIRVPACASTRVWVRAFGRVPCAHVRVLCVAFSCASPCGCTPPMRTRRKSCAIIRGTRARAACTSASTTAGASSSAVRRPTSSQPQ